VRPLDFYFSAGLKFRVEQPDSKSVKGWAKKRGHLVLVVDDDLDVREVERQMLDFAGYEVLVAGNGREALETLSDQRPSVILLDLMMPVMDGLTFLAERRRLGLGEDIPVVCVSAGGKEMLQQALRLGAKECLQKPPDFDELFDRVEHYCQAT